MRLAAECGRSPGEFAEHLISQSLQESFVLKGGLGGEVDDQADQAARS